MKMKVLFLIWAILLLNANFTGALIIIEDGYFEALTLNDYESLLMTGGGASIKSV